MRVKTFFRVLRLTSVVVLFFFLWSFGPIWQAVAYAAEGKQRAESKAQSTKSQKASEPRPQTAGEKFETALEDIRQHINKAEEKSRKGQEPADEINAIKSRKTDIEELDSALKSEFAATEKKLKDAKLPSEILSRHQKFVAHYQSNLQTLIANLDALPKAEKKSEVDAAVRKTKDHLEKTKAPSKHKPLDPNKLPNRMVKAKAKAPRLTPDEYRRDFPQHKMKSKQKVADNRLLPDLLASRQQYKPVLLAFNEIASDIPISFGVQPLNPQSAIRNPQFMIAQATDQPSADDLSETPEVQFTDAIRAKAQELGNNPVKIYEYVRNNIEFAPTYGSIQGADMCLQTKQCNAFDTASLLVALLRTSNISAHYVYGTIEVPIDKVMNWAGGFSDSTSAINFIASGNIPITSFLSGGKISAVRMEHVWVEAWIDYIPSRGAVQRQGNTWIPLDASFKLFDYSNSVNVWNATGVDSQTFYSNLKSFIAVDNTSQEVTNVDLTSMSNNLTNLQGNFTSYLDNNQSNSSLRDIFGGRSIKQKQSGILSSTLPYKITTVLSKYSEIPDSYRYKVEIQMTDEGGSILLPGTIKSLPELAGKKITISYDPATDGDTNILKNYSVAGVNTLPAYMINLVPSLKVEGTELARGTTITMGSPVTINLTFIEPGGTQDLVNHSRTAGEFSALVLNYGNISATLLSQRSDKLKITKTLLENGQTDTVTKDDLLGETLNIAMLGYWAKSEFASKMFALTKNVDAVLLPSEGLNTLAVTTSSIMGTPYQITGGGMSIDIQRSVSVVVSKDGNAAHSLGFMSMKGSYDSYLESGIYDDIFQQTGAGVSGASIIKLAAEQGIPIYFVNANNVNNILPLLQVDSSVTTDIINAVNSGKHVIVPQREILHNGWQGTGYVIIDPQSGSGAYMISGGMAGGFSPIDWFNNLGLAGKIITVIILGIVAALVIALLVWALVALIAYLIPLISDLVLYLSIIASENWLTISNIPLIKCLIATLAIYNSPDPNPVPSQDDMPYIFGILMALMAANAC